MEVIDESRDEIENLVDVEDSYSNPKPLSNRPTQIVELSPELSPKHEK